MFILTHLPLRQMHKTEFFILNQVLKMVISGLKETIVQLESSLTEKQNEILFLEEEVRSLRMKLTKRDAELAKQERELNKLRVKLTMKFVFK